MLISIFRNLCRRIRFDINNTRGERLQLDILTLMLIANLSSKYVTANEQLFSYKGKTKFIKYIPSKPAKYGLWTFSVCDTQKRIKGNEQSKICDIQKKIKGNKQSKICDIRSNSQKKHYNGQHFCNIAFSYFPETCY